MKLVILTHPNCQDENCKTCLAEHLALGKQLDRMCKTRNKKDHLGRIHKWMSDNGFVPETEWGWATPETFLPTIVKAYVRDYKKSEDK